MKKRSTRRRIAAAMAGLTGGVLFVVAGLINVIMIAAMYQGENQAMMMDQIKTVHSNRPFGGRFARTIAVSREEVLLLQESTVRRNVANIDDDRYLYTDQGFVREVTGHIERQKIIVAWSLAVVLLASVVCYWLAWVLTARLMIDIRTLTDFVEGRTIESLDHSLEMPHLPQDDVLARLARSMIATNQKLDKQITSIKQFARYAAHELRSPLMSMQSSIELALKTQNYHKYIRRIQDTVMGMQSTIQTLLVTIQPQSQVFESEKVVLGRVIHGICEVIQQEYNTTFSLYGTDNVTLHTQRSVLETILRNLIENAGKYHEGDQSIQIYWENKQVKIVNKSSKLTAEQIDFVWIPFWQHDSSDIQGQGLGLSLVQTLVKHMNWRVMMEVDEGVVTTTLFLDR